MLPARGAACATISGMWSREAEAMVPAEVIRRVYSMECKFPGGDSEHGTCFSIQEKGEEYLVTAAHILHGYPPGSRLEIGCVTEGGMATESVSPKLITINEKHDIAVFEAPKCIKYPELPLKAKLEGMTLGQRVMWMGFPLGYDGGLRLGESGGRIGLVGGGTLASFEVPAYFQGKREGFLVEGASNLGCSGSPVVLYPGEQRGKGIQVAGVVSAMLPLSHNLNLIMAGALETVMKEISG